MLKRAQPARLLAVDRDASGTRLLILGRDEAVVGKTAGLRLQVPDTSVADRHALIRYARGRYYVSDLKSEGGTFLNGRRIRRTQPLKHGDNLRFGAGIPYRFIDPDAMRRRRERRILRAAAVIAVLLVFGWFDHREKWNLLSVATVTKIAAWAHPPAVAKRPDAIVVAAAATPRTAAPPQISVANMPASASKTLARADKAPAPIHAAPVIAPTPNLSASSPTPWLDRINFYRSGLGLAEIHADSALSGAVGSHARYIVLNFGDDIRAAQPMTPAAYDENPGKPGYTASGAHEAPNLQLAWGCAPYDAEAQVDRWIAGPFHRLSMLSPFLTEAAFGQFASNGCWAAALLFPPPPSEEVKPYARAVEFPPDGASIALDWTGIESPDPLASCPGYERPSGLPITLQLGHRVETNLTAHSLLENGRPIEHCAFDAKSYLNQDARGQEYGRWSLRNAGAVMIVPRAPLHAGAHYSVSVTAEDLVYAWSFTAAETTKFLATPKFPVSPTPAPTVSPMLVPAKTESSGTGPGKTAVVRPRPKARPSHSATSAAAAPMILADNSPAAISTSRNWLEVLNEYRARLNVPTVTEDPRLSRGDIAHVKYLMTNYSHVFADGGHIGALYHQEDETKPRYSVEGLKAAHSSDVMYQSRGNKQTEDQLMEKAIEWWISGPFHRAPLLNPELRKVGFGQYCEGTGCVSALDSLSDAPLAPSSGRALANPIEVPPDGATVKAPGFGGEWPDPVSPCPGYSNLAPAITLQLGMHVPAKITDASLTQTSGTAAGTKVVTCAYDSEGYTNPDSFTQTKGREILGSFGEVVMMVRDPLASGASYRVAMTVNGKPYGWTFSTLP